MGLKTMSVVQLVSGRVVTINAKDFNADLYALVSAQQSARAPAPPSAPPPVPEPVSPLEELVPAQEPAAPAPEPEPEPRRRRGR